MAASMKFLAASLAIIATTGAGQAQEVVVKIGAVRSISTVSILWAVEKGYFREYGIKVVNDILDTAANSIALLAQNQLQLVEGGISAISTRWRRTCRSPWCSTACPARSATT
jgi:ABC-type nitrate/sulfonate/bicarbonate transport system substrate-binding protein